MADHSALRTGLRNTLVATGVAAAATGISVSTGVLDSDGALTSTAAAAGSQTAPAPAEKPDQSTTCWTASRPCRVPLATGAPPSTS